MAGQRAIGRLQQRIEARATAKTHDWWNRYLKGAIEFRGTKMADIRREVHRWWSDEQLAESSSDNQLAAALTLLRQPMAEDKLAGILILQEILLDDLDCSTDLDAIGALFDEGAIADWSTCDWLCVRVLGPLSEAGGERCTRAIAAWVESDDLWKRRAAAVAFVNRAPRALEAFEGFVAMLLDVCATNARYPERFSQTSVGWLLRELSDAVPSEVVTFLDEHRELLSREALRMASARLPDRDRDRLLGRSGLKRGRR